MRHDAVLLAEDAARPRIVKLWEALRPLASTIAFMQTGAHPDDETSGLLALLGRREGYRLSFACATRGEGGQNAIGPERGLDLAALRTREMELAAQTLGLTLYWLSEDLGDPIADFRFSKSGEETLARWGYERTLQRMIRIIRIEKPDAICPTFLDTPGQHGHHRAMTRIAREAFDLAGDVTIFPEQIAAGLKPWSVAKFYLPAWSGAGASYDDEEPPPNPTLHFDVGEIEPFSGAPYARIGEWSRRFHATQGMGRWIDAAPTPRPLHLAASRVGAAPSAEQSIADHLPLHLGDWAEMISGDARSDLQKAHDEIGAALTTSLLDAKLAMHLKAALAATRAARGKLAADAADVIDHRLARKEAELARAIAIAANEQLVVSPQARPRTLTISPAQSAIALNRALDRHACALAATVAAGDEAFDGEISLTPAAGLTTTRAHVTIAAGETAKVRLTAEFHSTDRRGIKELSWRANDAPAADIREFFYPHLGRVTRAAPAIMRLRAIDVAIAEHTRVAYIGAGRDRVDDWLRQIGVDVETISDDHLADIDLTAFSTVLIGVFAFGLRGDLAAQRSRLHDFVRAGGHLATLYHRPGDGWDPQRVPLAPIEIGAPSLRWRVTNADAPVTLLAPDHPLLTAPNRIGDADWSGWATERGLYFARAWDDAYRPLIALADPGEAPHRGALLSGRFGDGRHTHVALALHAELEHLTPGAFRLMANIVAPAR